jgi:hypothetical protein
MKAEKERKQRECYVCAQERSRATSAIITTGKT